MGYSMPPTGPLTEIATGSRPSPSSCSTLFSAAPLRRSTVSVALTSVVSGESLNTSPVCGIT